MGNDLWKTPHWLFNWLNQIYGPFDIDLAANEKNAKLPRYYSLDNNALKQSWHLDARNGFCNPPYSDLSPWLEKAKFERFKGFSSTWVLPSWNGEQFWRGALFENAATYLTLIFGRVAFLDYDGAPVAGNRAGTMIAHYNGIYSENVRKGSMIFTPKILYANRDGLIKDYSK